MQTFLPYPDYELSAKSLDNRRLNKQRVEVLQILNVLHQVNDSGAGWRNHPAVKMWRGYEPQLCEYGLVMCEEWIRRGYSDSVKEKLEWHLDCATAGEFTLEKPWWFGDQDFHLSHRSNLLRKDPDHYGKIFGDIPNNLPYKWPELEEQ